MTTNNLYIDIIGAEIVLFDIEFELSKDGNGLDEPRTTELDKLSFKMGVEINDFILPIVKESVDEEIYNEYQIKAETQLTSHIFNNIDEIIEENQRYEYEEGIA